MVFGCWWLISGLDLVFCLPACLLIIVCGVVCWLGVDFRDGFAGFEPVGLFCFGVVWMLVDCVFGFLW